jgi:GNAT superfamily N-acetyltransferase
LIDPDGEIVAMLEGSRHYPDDSTWWIGLLLLAPEIRGRGIGRRLVSALSELTRAEDGTALMLGVVADNETAYQFWLALGFERVRTTGARQFGRKIQPVVVMRRAL